MICISHSATILLFLFESVRHSTMIQKNNTPQKEIFSLFSDHCERIIEASGYLKAISLHKNPTTSLDTLMVAKLETDADTITYAIHETIMKRFILPLDKDDLTNLIETMDDIIDTLERIENRLHIYTLKPNGDVHDFAELVQKAAQNIQIGIQEIEKSRFTSGEFYQVCRNLNSLESTADSQHRNRLQKLMGNTKSDPVNIIKWHDIYVFMEQVFDSCERVAQIFELIRSKYS
jgi:uncharacterized protein